ncbi:MAG: hypothetical protein IJV06_11850 [Bacteroidaceae bacterium]|nr:hypothetical protein [Bacteroidaceae bacterium]
MNLRFFSLCALTLFSVLCASAQTTEFQKAIAKYKNATTVTATAVKTTHRTSVAKDDVVSGTLIIQRPNKMNITVNQGKDQLDMTGADFTMTMRGKSHKTSSKKNPLFATFQTVLETIITGGATPANLNDRQDVKIEKQQGNIVLTILPAADSSSAQKKASKRQMFTSFVITINTQTSEIRSLRMNEKGQNYTNYDFSNYSFQ